MVVLLEISYGTSRSTAAGGGDDARAEVEYCRSYATVRGEAVNFVLADYELNADAMPGERRLILVRRRWGCD
jgi:hypothetical protein